ncbi:AEC family transporter [Corynebacterium sp. CCM 9185]|uniref:AEC family transporter n=1 Tax=Corynebacterium marambiense TaxID=2765364 RepID=A0ABS0VRF6_9CORY|nr:AEC family transporter [Corynebacterium marambiense]MCK7664421.1 AEC family transporter [Corynebacterium marambiense]
MTDVAAGFSMVFGVIAVGALVGRLRVLGENAPQVLNRFVFFVALPALVFGRVAVADWSTIMAPSSAVSAVSALIVGVGVSSLTRLLPGVSGPAAVIAGLSSSYCNAANLGLPLAVHVLGDAAAVVPLLLFQVGFYGPLTLTLLESLTGGRGLSPRILIRSALANPVVVAALAGGVSNACGWRPAGPVDGAVSLLAGAAVPVALIAFGMSLATVRVLDSATVSRRTLAVAVVGKNIVHPVVACLLGVALGLDEAMLLTVTVLAALPTAQNVFVYADRYGVTTGLARDAAVISTMVSVPVIVAVSALLGRW